MQAPSSIYEAFRTYKGKVALQPEHQARFERSLREIDYAGSIPDVVQTGLSQTKVLSGEDRKIWVTMDKEGQWKVDSEALPLYGGSFLWPETWKVKRIVGARKSPHLKSTDTDFQRQARAEALQEGYDEVLMIDSEGVVREGGITNVFFEKDGVLITPDQGMLPGVCRELILTAAERLEIPVELRTVREEEIEDMDAMFMSSSIRGMVATGPVTSLMRRLASWCGSLIERRISEPKDTAFMGVLNVTPDSFSDGGKFFWMDDGEAESRLMEEARRMVEASASILDVGGESTGPGSQDVALEEELRRVVATVERLNQEFPETTISVDTWKSEVAEAAVKAGARMINDVTAGRGDERIFEVAARTGMPLVLMYSKDPSPRTTRDPINYEDVMQTIKKFLSERIEKARAAGVQTIIVDPGMGAFVSGEPRYSYEILDRLEELRELACPILVGTSKKGFLGEDREGSTLATTLWLKGRVDYLRVHDVLENATVSA